MNQITKLSTSSLHIHPENTKFFDDIEGKQYERFKKSIQEDGVLTPLIIAPDMTIISGHQRYKACKDLNINLVPVIIREDLVDENEKRKKLLATNFGREKNNPMKQSRVISEYERLCEIKQGRPSKLRNNFAVSQNQIAEEFGITPRQVQNLKKLQDLIPELQDMVEANELTSTVGYKIWAKMPQEEQEKFFNDIGREKIKTLTQKATQQYIDEINNLERELENEKNKKPEVVVKEIEKVIDNTDYSLENKFKNIKKELEDKNRLYSILKEKEVALKEQLELYKEDEEKYNKLTRSIELLTKEKDDISRAVTSTTELSGYIYKLEDLLKNELAPIKYSRSLMDCKDNPVVINNVTEIVECVENWCREIRNCLPNNQQNIINVEVL